MKRVLILLAFISIAFQVIASFKQLSTVPTFTSEMNEQICLEEGI